MSRLAWYKRHYAALTQPLLALMTHGIRVDRDAAARKLRALQARCSAIQARLDEIAGADTCTCGHKGTHEARQVNLHHGKPKKDGTPRKEKWAERWLCMEPKCGCANFTPAHPSLTAERDLASPRVIKFLYGTLGLPKQRKRGEGTLTADEVALRKLLLKAASHTAQPKAHKRWQREPAVAVEVLTLLLEHREKAKLMAYVNADKFDRDGRIRCMLKVTTEPGRLASSRNPFGTGYNLQNIPRPSKDKPHTLIREIFIPDEGHVFLEVDYSQIEDRMVKVLSKDPEAIRQARLRPTEFDAHTVSTRRIFARILRCREDQVEITKDRRDIGKRTRHGVNYGEGAKKLWEILLKDEQVLPLAQCKALIEAGQEAYVRTYQQETRKRIMRDRVLVNSWGRRLDFNHERLNDDTYRRGYAWRAASENADCLNQLGLIPLYHYIREHGLASRVVSQVHDSLLVSCPVHEVYEVARFLVNSMETERTYEGIPLAVPVEIKLGSTWLCEREFKALPSRIELEGAAADMLGLARRKKKEAA